MEMSFLSALAKYLREDLVDDDEFQKSLAEEHIAVNQWILRRSYSSHPHIIQEQFRVELRDQVAIPHVVCALKLTLRGRDAPQDDARMKIFRPHVWFGPDLEVEVVRDSEFDPESETPEDDQDHSVEKRIIIIAKKYVRGCQILLQVPTKEQRGRLTGIRQFVNEDHQNDNAGNTVRLRARWQQWKEEGVKADRICSKTYSYTKQRERESASIHNVACYLTGITLHDELLPLGHRPPPKSEDQSAYNCGRGVQRILKLVSKLAEYYGDDIAIATFTFLEVGAFGVARLGHTALGDDEDFFYDALVTLIDLSWRRLTAAHPETRQDGNLYVTNRRAHQAASNEVPVKDVPVINPFGFHSWYTEADYDATCEKLNQGAFMNAPEAIAYELSSSTLLSKAREKSKSLSPDRSKTFVLDYAQRLAKYISYDDRVKRVRGYQDSDGDLELALRIMGGTASTEERMTASTAVVDIIVDILLDRCPKPKKALKEKRVTKRKRASGDAECASGRSLSAGHCGPQQQSPQWTSRGLESATESNLQVRPGIAHDEVNNATSSTPDQESIIPGFGDPAQAMLAAGSSNYANRPYDSERDASGTVLSPVSASREPHIENALGQSPTNLLAMTVPAGLSNMENQCGLTNTWSLTEFGMGMDAHESLPPFNPQLNTDNSWTGAGGMDITTALSLFGSYCGSSDNLFQG